MLGNLFGQFATDLAIDLGTANTLISVPGEGLVLNEPSVVAVEQSSPVAAPWVTWPARCSAARRARFP